MLFEDPTAALTEVTRTSLPRFDVPKPREAGVELRYGLQAPEATTLALRDAHRLRDEVVSACNAAAPDPTILIARSEAYAPSALKLLSTEKCARLEEAKTARPEYSQYVWTSVLDNRPRSGTWSNPDAEFEVAHVLNLLALSHCNAAQAAASPTTSADMATAAKHYRTAAGVFHFLAAHVLESWRERKPATRDPEVEAAVAKGLGEACLAMAQQCAFYKAESEGKFTVLPKLAVGASDMYRNALRTMSSGLTSDMYSKMDPAIMETMTVMADCMKAVSFKFAGKAAYNENQFGQAQAYLMAAKAIMNGMTSVRTPALNASVTIECRVINLLAEQYALENRTIYFMEIPAEGDLAVIPPLAFAKMIDWEVGSAWQTPLELPPPQAMPKPAPASSRSETKEPDDVVQSQPAQAPAGKTKMTFACSSCKEFMTTTAGNARVACPKCSKVNCSVTCGACRDLIVFLEGNKLVRCPACSKVNRIP